MTPNRVSDDGLCWAAVRKPLSRETRRMGWFGAAVCSAVGLIVGVAIGGGPGVWAMGVAVGVAAGAAAFRTASRAGEYRMKKFTFAVLDASRELSPDERSRLRATGQVPDWFVDRVIERERAAPR